MVHHPRCVFINYNWINQTVKHNYLVVRYMLLPNIVRVIKSRRMRWAGHVARMGEERGGV